MGEVMDVLTAAVMDHDGVDHDYYGDGLAAMWNAPADQPEHPELACRAALAMIEALPAVGRSDGPTCCRRIADGRGRAHGDGASWQRRQQSAGEIRAARVERESGAADRGGDQGDRRAVVVSQATAARLSNRLQRSRFVGPSLPGIEQPVDLFGVWPGDGLIVRRMTKWPTIGGLSCLNNLSRFSWRPQHALVARSRGRHHGQLPTAFLAGQIEQAAGRRSGGAAAADAGRGRRAMR